MVPKQYEISRRVGRNVAFRAELARRLRNAVPAECGTMLERVRECGAWPWYGVESDEDSEGLG